MTREEFQRMMTGDYNVIVSLNNRKGNDYAGTQDALRNFKEQATEAGLTPIQVWYVLFGKHLKAIQTYVREGQVESEPIEGRVQDAILYLFLLLGLVREGQEAAAVVDAVPSERDLLQR